MERGGQTREERGSVSRGLVVLYLVAILCAIGAAQLLSADVVIDHDAIRIDGETAQGCLFNDGNTIGTDAGCTYDPDTDTLEVSGNVNAGGFGAVDDDPNNAIAGYQNTTGNPTCSSNCGADEICMVDANTPYGRGPVFCRGTSLVGYGLFANNIRGFDLSASWSPPGQCDTWGEIDADDPNDRINVSFLHPFTTLCNAGGWSVQGDSDLWMDNDALRSYIPVERHVDVVNANWNIGGGDRVSQVDSYGAGVDATRRQIIMGDGDPNTASADPNVDPDHEMFRGVVIPICDDPNSVIHLTDPGLDVGMPSMSCDPIVIDGLTQLADMCGPDEGIFRNGGDSAWICDEPEGGSSTDEWVYTWPSIDAADDVVIGKNTGSMTLASFDCVARGGSITSVMLVLRECDSDGANCVGVGGVVTLNALNTNFSDSSFTDEDIDDGDWLEIMVSAVSGAPDFVHCSVEFTRG